MIIHCCSHFGDIEVEARGQDESLVRWVALTPMEREALDGYLATVELERTADDGELLVPRSAIEVGACIGERLHQGSALITAVRFSTGEVRATTSPIRSWLSGLLGWFKRAPAKAIETASEVLDDADLPCPEPEAAVQAPVPRRGCPMPSMTELREIKAAAVVRKFLTPRQAADFDRRRAFVTVGRDTGHLYRVTSRWSPEVSRYGVLYDLTDRHSICASNQDMPPSEEVLSMKFAVEIMERRFLGHSDDALFIDRLPVAYRS